MCIKTENLNCRRLTPQHFEQKCFKAFSLSRLPCIYICVCVYMYVYILYTYIHIYIYIHLSYTSNSFSKGSWDMCYRKDSSWRKPMKAMLFCLYVLQN